MAKLPLFGKLRGDRRGSVAIETAIVIPIACLVVIGFYETYSYVRAVALVERAAFSVANMMARQQGALHNCRESGDALNLGTYIAAAQEMVKPLALSTKGMVFLSGVNGPAAGTNVAWQHHSTYTLSGVSSSIGKQGQTIDLPGGIDPTGAADTVLVAEVIYRYRPFAMTAHLWPSAPGEVTIARQAYYRGRTANLSALTPGTTPCTALP